MTIDQEPAPAVAPPATVAPITSWDHTVKRKSDAKRTGYQPPGQGGGGRCGGRWRGSPASGVGGA